MPTPAPRPSAPAAPSIPADGAGSFDGMATEPVATAASANPLLKTLVAAVGEAGLGRHPELGRRHHRLRADRRRVRQDPEEGPRRLLADKATLTKILTYHVVPGQLAPDQLAGTHKTLEGDELTVEGSGEDFTVGAGDAAVVCGNVQTANATVYVIDSVLMPRLTDQVTAPDVSEDQSWNTPAGRLRRPVLRGWGAGGAAGLGPDLADLLRLSARGDEAAFARLYDATAPRVFGLALRVVRDPAQAEEVTQEAFLEIWRTAGTLRPRPGQPALVAAHDHAPQGGRPGPVGRGGHPPRHDVPPAATSRSSTTRPPRPPRPRSRHAASAARWPTLTEVQREAVGLAYFGGYTHTEVATMLDLPVGTAKTRIRDGLIRLRDAMGVGS